jgi:pimeloyl-ACP methyl ester carboxylesterase
MKIIYWILIIIAIALVFFIYLYPRNNNNIDHTRIIRRIFKAVSLEGNCMKEDINRSVSIYLPPGYNTSRKNYPCLYFLHGFNSGDDAIDDLGIQALFDKAIEDKLISPLIVVLPNSRTKFKGSYYTNSALAGGWADYIGKDLVQYIDSQFRTIKNRESRGIAGYSMGGSGALKLAMLFPDVFGSVYALSPSIMYWAGELVPEHPAFKTIQEARDIKDIEDIQYAIGFVAVGSTYSANLSKPPFYCDMPVHYENGKMIKDSAVLNQWDREFPLMMVDHHHNDLRKMKGIAFDWGMQDGFTHLPITCNMLDEKLNAAKIPHIAMPYQGDHFNRITGFEGRIYKHVIPFFSKHLSP